MEIRKNSGIFKWVLIAICVVFLSVMLILPLVYIIVTALRDGLPTFIKAITDPYARSAVSLTVKATLWAVVLNTVFGLCAAWCITKFHFRGKRVISALIDLPLTFGRQSFFYPYLREMGITVIFAVPGVVLATIFVTFPFISREIIPVLTAQGTDEEEAAALMGANAFTIFTKITLPHIRWALLYGIVLCAARAMGEFGAVSVLSGHLRGKTNTMPLYIELLYQGYDFTGAFAMSSLLVVMAVILLVLRNILEHRGKSREKGEQV